jgi:hypothetical protein
MEPSTCKQRKCSLCTKRRSIHSFSSTSNISICNLCLGLCKYCGGPNVGGKAKCKSCLANDKAKRHSIKAVVIRNFLILIIRLIFFHCNRIDRRSGNLGTVIWSLLTFQIAIRPCSPNCILLLVTLLNILFAIILQWRR